MTKAVDPFRVTKQLDPSVLGAIAHRLGTRGRHPSFAKLTAFAVSSYIVGVAGALWAFVYLGAWEPLAFNIDRSFQLLFMVIIGGLGSILGSFLGPRSS